MAAPSALVVPPGAPRVALATCAELLAACGRATASYGTTGADDDFLTAALAARGIPYALHAWDAPGVDWAAFAAVLVRTTWDYSASEAKAAAFSGWAARLGAAGVRTRQAPPVLRWNAHKRYLRDLADRGVLTIPTLFLSSCDAAEGAGDALPPPPHTRTLPSCCARAGGAPR